MTIAMDSDMASILIGTGILVNKLMLGSYNEHDIMQVSYVYMKPYQSRH